MTKNISYIIVLLLLVSTSCEEDPITIEDTYSCSSNIALEIDHPKANDFEQFLQIKVAEGLPGMSMLISTPEGFYQGAAGVADIPNNIAMKPCHIHRVGSITKQFTAAIIMLLYQDGELNLDDKIKDILSAHTLTDIANAEEATIRHLLTHSSGIPDIYEIDFWLEFYDDPTRVRRAKEEMEYARNLDADFAVGTYWHYSNTNYILLQLISEKITGKTYETLLDERIISPLGLESTYFDDRGESPSNVVRGYTDALDNGELTDVTDYAFGVANGTGGIFSNAYDILLFHQAFKEPGILWQQEILDEMLSPNHLPFFELDDWDFGDENKVNRVNGIGMGWLELDTDYGKAYGHNGGLMGRKARAWYFPESDSHIIFFINANGGQVDEVSREIFRNEMIELLFE